MKDAVVSLVDEVRLLHHRLVALASELHRDLDLTPPQRAVLEYLYRHDAATVPGVARARGVTRQHIQTIANELLARDLVTASHNPAHRRSPLLGLTPAGRTLIETVLHRERDYVRGNLADLEDARLRDAAAVLAGLRSRL